MKAPDLFFAARPLLHLPIWSVYLVALHYHDELSGGHFGWISLAVLLCLNLTAAGAYYFNQVHDYESDRVNQKLGFLQREFLNVRELMGGYLVLTIAAIAIAPSISPVILAIILQGFLLGYIYSAPPLRLKDRPLWGLVANAWVLGFLVAFSVMPNINFNNSGLLGWDSPFYFAFAVGAVYVLTTVPDVKGDSSTGKRTLAVRFGRTPAVLIALVLHLLSLHVAYRSGFMPLVGLSGVAVLITLAALVIKAQSTLLLAIKLPILLLTLLAGYFYPAYLVFIVALIFVTRLYYRRRFGMTYPKLA
jgi:4-hydroxybenzoate polyprenyltransferase